MAAERDLTLRRNEDISETWSLTDGGAPLDLTGCTVACQVRAPLDNAVVVEAATITIADPTSGKFDFMLKASEGSALSAYGDPLQTANLVYDVRLTYSDGIKTDLVAGRIVLLRGVTHS